MFVFVITPRPALGPTQPPIQGIEADPPSVVKLSKTEADQPTSI
jgi:hypothetical protein